MKNIIIFGKNGFISKKLINLLKKNKIKHKSFGKKEIDLTKKTSINLIKKNIENNAIIVFISSIVPVKKISTFNKNLRMLENFLLVRTQFTLIVENLYLNIHYAGHHHYMAICI